MSWAARALDWLFGAPRIDSAREARLLRWRRLPPVDLLPHAAARYVVVDLETSGLDLRRDRVIAIGAIGLNGLMIDFADCFETVLRQARASGAANIVIHGIGGERQLGGADPAEALLSFLEYAGASTLVAFRAEFDQVVLERETRATLGVGLHRRFVDLAWLLPALYPGEECRSLDDWTARFGIPMEERHQALADALVTAQLLQVALHRASAYGMANARRLIRMQNAQRWLGKKA